MRTHSALVLLAVIALTTSEAASQPTAATPALGRPQVSVRNSIGMKLVLIPAGTFSMGSPQSDADAADYEMPQRRVTISRPFYLGLTEVTQAQYEQVMGQNPSESKGDPQRPVENVSWSEAAAFCRRLSAKEGKPYRLPTEAEWEYACRAGSTTRWSYGDAETSLGDYAWYTDNSGDAPHPVGTKKPNPWGLYDMHGNVEEWCADWFDNELYDGRPATDPQGPPTGKYRVIRGGSWLDDPAGTRSADRFGSTPDERDVSIGLRVVRTP